MPELAGLLLAAGGSSRLGQPKQLVEVDGQPLVLRQAGLLREFCEPVVVVTGAGAQQVEETLLDARVRCVRNPHWRSGMGSSISAGVGALPGSVSALLVLLCDQYAVTVQDLQGLVEHWEHKPQLSIGSQVRDRIGPPAIFPRSRFAELSELRGDQGARALLNAEDQRTVTWHLAPAGIDLDTPDQLQRMKTGH